MLLVRADDASLDLDRAHRDRCVVHRRPADDEDETIALHPQVLPVHVRELDVSGIERCAGEVRADHGKACHQVGHAPAVGVEVDREEREGEGDRDRAAHREAGRRQRGSRGIAVLDGGLRLIDLRALEAVVDQLGLLEGLLGIEDVLAPRAPERRMCAETRPRRHPVGGVALRTAHGHRIAPRMRPPWRLAIRSTPPIRGDD